MDYTFYPLQLAWPMDVLVHKHLDDLSLGTTELDIKQ